MKIIDLDALQLIKDHEQVMTLVTNQILTPQQRESLESLDNLLSELRQGLIEDGDVRIAATQLESARDLDRKLMAELQD